jgi:hypothetical protein
VTCQGVIYLKLDLTHPVAAGGTSTYMMVICWYYKLTSVSLAQHSASWAECTSLELETVKWERYLSKLDE